MSEFVGAYVIVLTVGFNVGGRGDRIRSTECASEFLGTYVFVLTVGFNVGATTTAAARSA